MKLIEIKDEGIGAYYISLLKQQIEMVNNTYNPDTDFLFYSSNFGLYKKKIVMKKNTVKIIAINSKALV